MSVSPSSSLKFHQEKIQSVLKQTSFSDRKVSLIAVSKTVSPEKMMELYQAGVRDFGENKVQELLEKKEKLPQDIRWHFIGHLQTNKVKQILKQVFLIHSLDRLDLAKEIQKEAQKQSLPQVPCLIQVNFSREVSKYGLVPEDVPGFIQAMDAMPAIRVQGLMTMGPLTDDLSRVREVFEDASKAFQTYQKNFPAIEWKFLSMGMSSDYDIALQAGANMVRLGTALFGERH